MNKIPKIVLSGGPCGGKTQGLHFLNQQLSKQGYTVFIIRECAENLISSGIDRNNAFEFQKAIALKQLENEKEAEFKAQKAEKPIIICDRGLADAKVYLSDADYNHLKFVLSLNDEDFIKRYDAVFHLDSAGISEYFENNDVRNETPAEAEHLNAISKKVWGNNSNFSVISVYSAFNDKLNMLLNEVLKFSKNYY